jgi:hypothetical protein
MKPASRELVNYPTGWWAIKEKAMSEKLTRILRCQAWERAKAELQGVVATFFVNDEATNPGQYRDFTKFMDKFIEDIEGNGLAE